MNKLKINGKQYVEITEEEFQNANSSVCLELIDEFGDVLAYFKLK